MSSVAASHPESALSPSSGSDDTAASSGAIEPPDSIQAVSAGLRSLTISASQPPATNMRDISHLHNKPGPSFPTSAFAYQLTDRHTSHAPSAPIATSSSYSTSPASRYGRHFSMSNSSSVDSQLNYDPYLAVPASPSMSEGLTDSPGSVSSMNSFRRGDLADIEDLDLEPELETVSECDEESSSLCSLDIGIDLDSDSERASSHGGDIDHLAIGPASSQFSRRSGSQPTAASDYARRKRSEWLLNNYANKIAARRPRRVKKGRISEIVEEGGECINTTVMPKPPCFASGASDWSCDVSGPPIAPPRSVSPSDSVPAIPSPLCSCVSADAAPATTAPGLEESVETIQGDLPATTVSAPSPSSAIVDQGSSTLVDTTQASKSGDAAPSGETELKSSPPRPSRTSSRRNSSPVKLRPCFRRQSSHQSGASTRESSCERDPPRGRSVRFSSRPPQEMRTHSPVEYDRKSCPVNNRLSPADVEELRTMKMEMGLLEARWAAVAACKPKKVLGTEGTTKPENHSAYNAGVAAMSASRERTPACGAESDSTLGPGSTTSPSSRLRQQKERERQQERQRNLPHYLRNRPGVSQAQSEPLSSEALSIRSKFGHAPPPPLPGMSAPRAPSASPSRSTSVPPRNRSAAEDGPASRRLSCQSMPSSGMAARATAEIPVPLLTQTSPSPPPSPHSTLNKDAPRSIGLSERGRSSGPRPALPCSSPWSSGTNSATSSIYSSTYFPSASTSPTPCVSYPGSNGYDSPASEFYESGSEYDMVC
ncbi:hypothetical protein PHSY_007382 [Pseudozyma hubeiensis SY62]|uniref:Uncharacterized protein n=1 Tax=Pseudozyma hubeiensis (strain SY62) TaxID=1305764 RepID=R9PEJ6_PSEHS|nr:hypothetical protein PHSY_007382 [Pseudozyma hubeiensis SY62]GAC99779.1 hypothetical protein PHSY_007382 [Pseudozyma hubeiensis SY62]